MIDEIIAQIEDRGPQKWYQRILDVIDREEISSFSEFETYGYYVSDNYSETFHSEECPNLVFRAEKAAYHLLYSIAARILGYHSISYHSPGQIFGSD